MAQSKSNGKDDRSNVFVLLCVLVLVVGIVAAAAMILAVLNYNNNDDAPIYINVGDSNGGPGPDGNGGGEGDTMENEDGRSPSADVHYDTKKWTFQVSGDSYNRVSYIDRKSRQFGGYLFDVINEVCLIAGKNCVLVHSDFSNCWNDGFPQEGLLGRWFDACSLWGVTLDRLRSTKFSKPFTQTSSPVFVSLPGNPLNFNPDSLDRAAIGFLNGWWSDRFCLLFSKDYDLADSQVVVYKDPNTALDALRNRDVDALYVSEGIMFPSGSTQVIEVARPCLQGGDAMMTRHDSLFKNWWDPAFEKLLSSRQYRGICDDIEDPMAHGDKPGGSADQICV